MPVTQPRLAGRRRRARRHVRHHRRAATCSCTTPTTRSPRRSTSSSARPRRTRRSWRSSSRCTARRATARIITSLIRAAERGKQVAALVELKARFDEANNIEWARALEEAGVHVTYGLVGLKTHTKTALVVREEGDGVRRYFHIGTGNYNEKTARRLRGPRPAHRRPRHRQPTSPSSSTSSPATAATSATASCWSRPTASATAIEELIRNEMAAPEGTGRIVMKMNSLVDPAIIDLLYEASAGGRGDRPRRPRHLLPASRGARAVREHPGAVDRRPLPRALPHLPLRQRRRARASRRTTSARPT